MKTIIALLITFFVVLQSQVSSQPFNVSLKQGDERMYRCLGYVYYFGPDRIHISFNSKVAASELNSDAIHDTITFINQFSGFPNTGITRDYFKRSDLPYAIIISKNGILQALTPWNSSSFDLYPITSPIQDTLTLFDENGSSRHASVIRQFDTTIFRKNVRAFTMYITSSNGFHLLTIADTFGLVKIASIQDSTDVVELINAILDGVEYNPEIQRYDYLTLRLGDVRQYEGSYAYWWKSPVVTGYSSEKIVDDTIISGKRWFTFTKPGVPRSFLLSDSTGVYQYFPPSNRYDTLIYSNFSPGKIFGRMIVNDTATVNLWGRNRKKISLSDGGVDWVEYVEWMEELGEVIHINETTGFWTSYSELKYAKLNGREFGTLLISVNQIQNPKNFSIEVFPNPIQTNSGSTVFRFSLPSNSPVTVEVYSLLGQKIFILLDEQFMEKGNYEIPFSTSGFKPGMYFYSMRTQDKTSIGKFILL